MFVILSDEFDLDTHVIETTLLQFYINLPHFRQFYIVDVSLPGIYKHQHR